MYNLFIYNVVSSKSLFLLADHLTAFLTAIEPAKNKRRLLEELYAQVHIFNLYSGAPGDSFQIYEEPDSPKLYLANYWVWQPTARENIALLEKIISVIHHNFRPSESPSLPRETICELVDMVNQRFGFADRVLHNRGLKILFLNNTHAIWNCYYSTKVDGVQVLDECIVMTSMPKAASTRQEFSFLHELGHVLHTHISKRLLTPPPSFIPFMESISHKPIILSDEDAAELFADCFAIACLFETPYAECDYIDFPAEKKIQLLRYMTTLIESEV